MNSYFVSLLSRTPVTEYTSRETLMRPRMLVPSYLHKQMQMVGHSSQNKTIERCRSRERTRTRRRKSPSTRTKRLDKSSRKRTRACGGSSPPPFDTDSLSDDDSSDDGSDRSLSALPPPPRKWRFSVGTQRVQPG